MEYPIVCYTKDDIKNRQSAFYDWMLLKIKVHFLFIPATNDACCIKCYEAIRGRDPKVKIILIAPELDMEVNALAHVFYNELPQLHFCDQAAVGDRSCPFCGTE